MEYENLKSIQKIGSESVSNRERKKANHVKGAEKIVQNLNEKAKALSSAKVELNQKTDKLNRFKLKAMEGDKRTQEQVEFFKDQGVKVRVKNQKPETVSEFKHNIQQAENDVTEQTTTIKDIVSEIAPVAAEKMISKLTHLVESYDVNKTENLKVLHEISSKETITADDFKTLTSMNEEVAHSKDVLPSLKESLLQGRPYALNTEAMEILSNEEFNLGYTRKQEVEVTVEQEAQAKAELDVKDKVLEAQNAESVAKDKPRQKVYADFHDTEKTHETVADVTPINSENASAVQKETKEVKEKSTLTEEIDVEMPMAAAVAAETIEETQPKESLLNKFKRSMNEKITKLQMKISNEYHKYTGEYLHKPEELSEEKVSEPTVDDSHEVVLEETLQKPEEITMDTVLKGQHSKIHTLHMKEGDVEAVYSLQMSDDLLTANMAEVEAGKQEFAQDNPDSLEVEKTSFMKVARDLSERLHPQNFTRDEKSEKLLNERVDPKIGDDLPEITEKDISLGNTDEIELEHEFEHSNIQLELPTR